MSNRPTQRPRRNGDQRPTPRDTAPSASDTRRDAEPDTDRFEDEEPEARDQRMEATGQYITVALCEEPVRVVPAGGWPMSAQRALRQGDFDGFMSAILHPDDYDLYVELDPTIDEFNQFTEDTGNLSGPGAGKAGGPNRSSRPTRKR